MERSFKAGNIDVVIRESGDKVEVELNGHPIDVSKVDGEYHSQLANQFTSFTTVDELVDTLVRNEGRFWSLGGGSAGTGGHEGHEGQGGHGGEGHEGHPDHEHGGHGGHG